MLEQRLANPKNEAGAAILSTKVTIESVHAHTDDGHNHPPGHNHVHLPAGGASLRLKVGLVLTLLFVIAEFGTGLWSGSLALVSDAGHNLTDALALGFSLWALSITRRAPNYNKTYGYHRAGILAAVINASTLVVIALFIFFEAAQRLLNPVPVAGWTMAGVAAVALLLNATIAFSLHQTAHSDLNVRSAFIHMMGDALSSVGVMVAGVGIALTGWLALDPLISILIGLFIVWSSWGIIKEATNILMEASPPGLDMDKLLVDMSHETKVRQIHDLHVWTIGSDFAALSCHVQTDNCTLEEANATVQNLNQMLRDKYDIRHATLQVEYQGCGQQREFCAGGDCC